CRHPSIYFFSLIPSLCYKSTLFPYTTLFRSNLAGIVWLETCIFLQSQILQAPTQTHLRNKLLKNFRAFLINPLNSKSGSVWLIALSRRTILATFLDLSTLF